MTTAAGAPARAQHESDDRWGPEWEAVVDVIVVGSGAAGGAAAALAAAEGLDVLILDKADFTGGTTAKSGGVMWVPANPVMREAGRDDPRPDALRYLARTAHPERYDPSHPTLGLSERHHAQLEAFYDRGAAILDRLTALGAWELEAVDYPDYYAGIPEDVVGTGRVIQPRYPEGWRRGVDPTGGQLLTDALLRVADEQGARVRTGTEVVHILRDDDGSVLGVEARTGVRTAIYGARRGVVFGSGGFVHDLELRRGHLRGPLLGGAAAETATGDFVRMGIEVGAALGNMSHAWWDQVAVEHAVTVPSTIKDVYSPFGDSMLMVNKYGVRVVNEKAVYNERGQAHFAWDPSRFEYPNLVLFWILDQAVFDDPEPSRFRWPVPMPGDPSPDFVFSAPDLASLAAEISRRLDDLAPHTGGLRLADDFLESLELTIAEFAEAARQGVDRRFARGEAAIERTWAGSARPGLPNPTMAPLDLDGPLHCVILGAGALDTKGGPVTDARGRVLDVAGDPIPGLYGAGNCVASPAGQAYWGPGGTIGPAVVFGGLAGLELAGVSGEEV